MACRGSSKYRGVRWHERNGKWEARIFDSENGKQISLGYYGSEEAAARAYDAESMRIRGPHAHVNLPVTTAAGRSRRRRQASPQGMRPSLTSASSQPPPLASINLQSVWALPNLKNVLKIGIYLTIRRGLHHWLRWMVGRSPGVCHDGCTSRRRWPQPCGGTWLHGTALGSEQLS